MFRFTDELVGEAIGPNKFPVKNYLISRDLMEMGATKKWQRKR
jgi:hypothetical protein